MGCSGSGYGYYDDCAAIDIATNWEPVECGARSCNQCIFNNGLCVGAGNGFNEDDPGGYDYPEDCAFPTQQMQTCSDIDLGGAVTQGADPNSAYHRCHRLSCGECKFDHAGMCIARGHISSNECQYANTFNGDCGGINVAGASIGKHRWCRVQSCFQCKYDGQAQACVSREDIAGTPTPTPSPSDNEPDFPPFAPLPCSETPEMCKVGNCNQYFGCAWHELLGMSCDLQDTGLQACAAECAGWGLCPEVGPLPCEVKNNFYRLHEYWQQNGGLPLPQDMAAARTWPFEDLADTVTPADMFDYLAQNGIDVTSQDSSCPTITPSPTPTSNTGGSLLAAASTTRRMITWRPVPGCDSSETTTASG